jgi:hypothetical protein
MFSVVFLASLVMLPVMRVGANSNEPITYSSGLTLYSPVNTTYSSSIIECNGTFDCPKGVQSSLNYSIDGKYQEGLPWKLDVNSIGNPDIYTIVGSFQLPQLSNGTHQLSIGIDEALYSQPVFDEFGRAMIKQPELINSTSWVNTVYFTIGSSQPTPTPSSAIGALIPAPMIAIIATVAVLVVTIISLLLFRRHRKTTKTTISPVFTHLHEG